MDGVHHHAGVYPATMCAMSAVVCCGYLRSIPFEKMNISYEYILYLATNIAAEYTVWKCVLLALSTEDAKTLQLPYSNCSAAGGIGIPC